MWLQCELRDEDTCLWDATLLYGVKLEQLFSLVCLALKVK